MLRTIKYQKSEFCFIYNPFDNKPQFFKITSYSANLCSLIGRTVGSVGCGVYKNVTGRLYLAKAEPQAAPNELVEVRVEELKA